MFPDWVSAAVSFWGPVPAGVPHSAQNLAAGSIFDPQLPQTGEAGEPQDVQNFAPDDSGCPQLTQTMSPPKSRLSCPPRLSGPSSALLVSAVPGPSQLIPMDDPGKAAMRRALRTDRTIDIVTTGARTGLPRTTEIWFTNVGGRIVICGTPSADGTPGPRKPRNWLANLAANPDFLFCLKESVNVRLTARARVVRDPAERRRIMSAPETAWYRDRGTSLEELVAASPIVDVRFTGEFASLNV